jgi:hypothetical protein
MTLKESQTLTKAMAQVKNISYIMDILFTPLSINHQDEQIEKKEKAYDYLKKYGVNTLKNSVEDIKTVTSKIPITDTLMT